MSRLINTIEDAVEYLDLLRISFYEQSAKREEIDPRQMAVIPADDSEGEVDIWAGFRASDSGIDYRCRFSVSFSGAEIRVDAVASYRSQESVEVTPDVIASFGNDVAVMALLPYVRQAISDLGSRIGYQTTLPMIARGVIEFAAPDSKADTD